MRLRACKSACTRIRRSGCPCMQSVRVHAFCSHAPPCHHLLSAASRQPKEERPAGGPMAGRPLLSEEAGRGGMGCLNGRHACMHSTACMQARRSTRPRVGEAERKAARLHV